MEEPTSAPPRDQTPYWDRVARAKTFSHEPDDDVLARFFPRDEPLLDLGCGYGRLTSRLAAAGYAAVGADRSCGMLARAREEHPRLRLVRLPDGPLPFASRRFGGVLLFSVLTCIPGAADQVALLDEVARILRPGGHLYVSDCLLQPDARNRERYDAGRERYGEEGLFDHEEGVTFSHLTTDRIARIDQRFERASYVERDVVTMNGNRVRAFQLVGTAR
ncbi:MAG: class I SAM-dependent methyltransferase [Planctomycetota bacterium]